MTRLKLTALAATLCLPVAAPAYAGEFAEPAVEPTLTAPTTTTAPRARGNWTGGYVGAQLGYGRASSSLNPDDATGPIGGVFAGYNHNFGGFVLGAEVGAAQTGMRFDDGSKIDGYVGAGLRFGVDAGDFMPYATVGMARASTSIGSDNGSFAGIGVDYLFTPQIAIGAEVRTFRFRDFAGTTLNSDAHAASLRMSFRF